jgi:hypothetical protein
MHVDGSTRLKATDEIEIFAIFINPQGHLARHLLTVNANRKSGSPAPGGVDSMNTMEKWPQAVTCSYWPIEYLSGETRLDFKKLALLLESNRFYPSNLEHEE